MKHEGSPLQVIPAVALCGAGLAVTAENPQDGRRLLYHLAPAIPATKTERGWEMDFGYCLVQG